MAVDPSFLTDDSGSVAAPPAPPDFARVIPISALADAKNQDAATAWGDEQRAQLAQQWGDMARGDLQSMVEQWWRDPVNSGDSYDSQQAQPEAPAAPDVNPVTAEPTTNPVVSQLLDGLGGLVDKLKASGQVPDPTAPSGEALPGGALGLGPHPATSTITQTDTSGGDLGADLAGAAEAYAQGGEAKRQALTGGMQDPDAPLDPQEREQAMQAALAMVAQPGESAPAADVAGQVLDAAHPLVQQAADMAGAQADKVAKVLNDAKQMARITASKNRERDLSPGQKAAYAVSKVQDATAQVATDPQAQEMVDKVLRPNDVAPTEPGADIWNSVKGMGDEATATPPPQEPPPPGRLGGGDEPPSPPPDAGLPPPPKNASPNLASAWQGTNKALIRLQMADPLYHDPNLISEAISTYFPDVRALGGIKDDLAFARSIKTDPEALAALKDEAPNFHLFSDSNAVGDVSKVAANALNDLPILGGVKAGFDWLSRSTFQGLGDTVQLMAYNAAKRAGNSPTVAGKLANAEVGALTSADRNGLMQGLSDNLLFAGKWVQGTGIQAGSVFGNPTFGGFAKDLTAAERGQLATALRGQFLKSLFNNALSTNVVNHVLSGHWAFQNEDGHKFDIDTGHQDAQGKEIYVTSPFFRRTTDVLHLLSVPGTPLSTATGTTTLSALNNKLNPGAQALEQVAPGIGQGSQYMVPSDQNPGVTPGPPIFTPGASNADKAKEAGAFAFNIASPVQVHAVAPARSSEGIKVANPQPEFRIGPDVSPEAKINPAAQVAGQLTGARLSSGPRDLSSKDEYFQRQEQTAYGDAAKPFQAAGVQLSTMPSTFTAGTGSNKVAVPTADADRPIFEKAYGDVLSKGVQQYQDKLTKPVLTSIEQKAFTAGKAAVEKTLTKDEVQRRVGVSQSNGPSPAAAAFWKGGASGQPPISPSSSPASSAGTATAFWKKAA